MRTWVIAALAGASLMHAARVEAQATGEGRSLRPGRVVVGAGPTWTWGYPVGDATARLRGNAVGVDPPPFALFRAESRVDAAAGVEARAGVAVTQALAVDVGFAFARPGLTTSISGDPETLATPIATERLAQYAIDVGATWQLPPAWVGGRLRPFVAGGGGYLRQLYDERTLVETGRVYYAGGGARYWLRGGDGRRRSLGLRGDVRAVWRQDGVEFEGRTRRFPTVTVQVFAEL